MVKRCCNHNVGGRLLGCVRGLSKAPTIPAQLNVGVLVMVGRFGYSEMLGGGCLDVFLLARGRAF